MNRVAKAATVLLSGVGATFGASFVMCVIVLFFFPDHGVASTVDRMEMLSIPVGTAGAFFGVWIAVRSFRGKKERKAVSNHEIHGTQ